MMGLSLALGLAAGGTPNDASALDAGAVAQAPSAQWCLVQHDGKSDQPACYENLITCVMAAFANASACTQQSAAPSEDAVNRRAPAVAPAPRRRTHASSTHKFSAAERHELYREFQKWQARSTHE